MWRILWWHCYYLELPRPLTSGHAYTVDVTGIDDPLKNHVAFAYNEQKTTSKAFKINQVGYASLAARRSTRQKRLGKVMNGLKP